MSETTFTVSSKGLLMSETVDSIDAKNIKAYQKAKQQLKYHQTAAMIFRCFRKACIVIAVAAGVLFYVRLSIHVLNDWGNGVYDKNDFSPIAWLMLTMLISVIAVFQIYLLTDKYCDRLKANKKLVEAFEKDRQALIAKAAQHTGMEIKSLED